MGIKIFNSFERLFFERRVWGSLLEQGDLWKVFPCSAAKHLEAPAVMVCLPHTLVEHQLVLSL
jgi:hypothetical protein